MMLMELKNLAVAVVAFVAVSVSIPAAAEPPIQPVRPSLVQRIAIMTIKTAIVTPGTRKALNVLLADTNGKPIDSKKIQLKINSKNGGGQLANPITVGTAITGADGDAMFWWTCPDLPQGDYTLEGVFAGDATTGSAMSVGDLSVMKAGVQIALQGDVVLASAGKGTAYAFSLFMFRASDQMGVDRTITVTINGKSEQVTTKNGQAQVPFTPQDAKTWDVKAQFNGDDHTLAASSERKYTHP